MAGVGTKESDLTAKRYAVNRPVRGAPSTGLTDKACGRVVC